MDEKTSGEGGDYRDRLEFVLIDSQTFLSTNIMPTAREKRKVRRQMEDVVHRERGMDLLTFKAMTWRQEEFWSLMEKNTVTLAHGAAGTGKTLLALWFGMTQVAKGEVGKVIYIRSDVGVEFQRGRGALPGDFNEKVRPLIGPVLDNLPVMMRNQGAAEYVIGKSIVEPVLLEDVRGRSFNDCFIVVDEAQNLLPNHVKTCLTRIGDGSKMAMVGDTRQADLEVFRRENGLLDAVHRLANMRDVGMVKFEKEDIVRNSVIAHILDRYDD